ncbi:DUF2723 domain-containing protein [Candidatus Gottesmanbacteria bacterium]|nr:DUF2723 domain-containing protein [Candidatus Gottesmanbacteria bacterium]
MSLLVGIASFVLFLFFQAKGIYGGDSGDLVTAAATGGVAHPPGYPLYTFLGWILNHLPLATPAWRVGLVSSIPHAVTVGLVYVFVYEITKKKIPALFSAVFLATNYLFFLYSVTPEVFALFDLFVVLLSYLLYKQKLLLASLVFGLSLAHHHVILFLLPAILCSIWKKWKAALLAFFAVGLLPYLYIPIAARGHSIVNWDRAVDLVGFIKLITRADYGTFVSGGFYGTEMIARLLDVKAYAQFVLLDFAWVGVLLAGIGFFWLWREKRALFWYFFLATSFLGPLFFFYASFPLVNRFTVGTYERFLLPSYVFLVVLAGVGLGGLEGLGGRRRIFQLISLLLFLVPLSRGAVTSWRFWGLAEDRTAENLAHDILDSLPAKSTLLIRQDTPLFTTQYVRYALNVRPDVAVIHVHGQQRDGYLTMIRANRDIALVYSNTRLPIEAGWFWVPEGLIYKLVAEKDLPTFAQLKKTNDAAWLTLHDPTRGILSRYNHLMLADVRDVYAGSRIEYGKVLLRGGDVTGALGQFQTAAAAAGDTYLPDAYTYVGLANLFLGKCRQANDAFGLARQVSLVPDKLLTLYEATVARDCEKNAGKAKELMDAYEKAKEKEDIPLEAK